MEYSVYAKSTPTDEGQILSGKNQISFGISKDNELPTPADLLVSAFAACCLKNVERFSEFLHFEYVSAEINVNAVREEQPPMIRKISFSLTIHSAEESINTKLLLKNLQKFGTIYNTLSAACDIEGEILIKKV